MRHNDIVITSNNKESKDMKKVIFTQEWMAMHPYEKPNEVDQYYTELANEIYHALDEACFTHQFQERGGSQAACTQHRRLL